MRSVALCVVATAALGLVGCGDDVVVVPQQQQQQQQNGGADADGGVDGAAAPAVRLHYHDEDFVESTQNRDPFRSYARLFKVRPPDAIQRRVVMPNVGIDEMTLIAIVTGTADARAMFTDPAGIGYIVERSDYIGRAEVVQTGGDQGMAVTLNWRVDRIRDGSVVLIREDPTAPGNPPLTRVIPLHDPNEAPQVAASGQGVTVVPTGAQGDGMGGGTSNAVLVPFQDEHQLAHRPQ